MKISEIFNIREISHIILAIITLAIVIGFSSILILDYELIAQAFLFAFVIILVSVYSKKFVAHLFDADVEHEIWKVKRYGYKPHWHLKKGLAAGIILPLLLAVVTLGVFKFMALLTYETRALKRRAARRFGFYSFTEMTEWHNALIGAAGILGILLLSIVAYFLPIAGLETLARLAAFYAFFNMLPLSKLDGTQIFFGSRILYATLAIITLIFTAYALILI